MQAFRSRLCSYLCAVILAFYIIVEGHTKNTNLTAADEDQDEGINARHYDIIVPKTGSRFGVGALQAPHVPLCISRAARV